MTVNIRFHAKKEKNNYIRQLCVRTDKIRLKQKEQENLALALPISILNFFILID